MSDYVCFLLTLIPLGNPSLVKCALRVKRDSLPDDVIEYPMETENLLALRSLLPEHVRSIGPIAEVELIFDVIV